MLADLFAFNTSPLELVIRGTTLYWVLLLMFRFLLRRDLGSLAVSDVLFIVLVADASQNGLSGSYDMVAEAVVLVGTLAAWNYVLDYAGYRVGWIHRLLEPPPLPLVRDGKVIARNLRREFLTMEDLHSQLRQAGIESLDDVKSACLESDGKFSVIERRQPAAPRPQGQGEQGPPGAG